MLVSKLSKLGPKRERDRGWNVVSLISLWDGKKYAKVSMAKKRTKHGRMDQSTIFILYLWYDHWFFFFMKIFGLDTSILSQVFFSHRDP